MLELESSAKDLALQFAQIAPNIRDVQPNGPRITSKKPQKATFGSSHRKGHKLKDLGDSNETLVGEEEKAKTDDAACTEGGVSLSEILMNMGTSWNSVSLHFAYGSSSHAALRFQWISVSLSIGWIFDGFTVGTRIIRRSEVHL
jgi:hypothetical protein